eukprot:1524248-Pyramimonas_sp.AAC.1
MHRPGVVMASSASRSPIQERTKMATPPLVSCAWVGIAGAQTDFHPCLMHQALACSMSSLEIRRCS